MIVQHGWPGAPHAVHWPAAHTVPSAVHASPDPRHLFVAESQQLVDAHGGEPSVQQAVPVKPHVFVVVVPPVHDWYAATSVAQFDSIAAFVALSSVTPSAVHFSCADAQLKYV